ncbi:MAG: stage 0 sporulation family protein [Candidatus Mcinerneyibacterium aminivorans]|uniref:Stage 0 sporulation family protein n=1 Tax=Candidatus Mcinerneyibacterium aminivorans TaxID=2703815 RepID=A0A5D0MCZ8_9BACT|nr:MAG: stage 0 sporulation family protein [Candidatus Mcinerneyibacterium aminivorans]
MIEVIGVQFHQAGNIYYFKPNDEEIKKGEHIIVETDKGKCVAEVVETKKKKSIEEIVLPLKKVVRKMNKDDLDYYEKLQKEEEEALEICEKKVKEHGLPMKLIGARYAFDKKFIMFYFSAEGRVDFRDLVRDLAKVFKTRIELRQIGVRDASKMMGGIGICGRRLCCSQWLRNFESVSVNMAKAQYLSLNPSKMSGLCGRLRCCLRYEKKQYEEMSEKYPNIGSRVKTPKGKGEVKNINIFTESVFVVLDESEAEIIVDITDIDNIGKNNKKNGGNDEKK